MASCFQQWLNIIAIVLLLLPTKMQGCGGGATSTNDGSTIGIPSSSETATASTAASTVAGGCTGCSTVLRQLTLAEIREPGPPPAGNGANFLTATSVAAPILTTGTNAATNCATLTVSCPPTVVASIRFLLQTNVFDYAQQFSFVLDCNAQGQWLTTTGVLPGQQGSVVEGYACVTAPPAGR